MFFRKILEKVRDTKKLQYSPTLGAQAPWELRHGGLQTAVARDGPLLLPKLSCHLGSDLGRERGTEEVAGAGSRSSLCGFNCNVVREPFP